MKYLLKNGTIVNDGKSYTADLLIEDDRISKIGTELSVTGNYTEIDCSGKLILPGCIDDQVHFREPGLTHKGNIRTESRAAVAGGITSFMEMPNTIPNALTQELLEDKYQIASQSSLANYSFFMGASNDNIEEVLKTNDKTICGVKIFMGSSTGNMLVDDEKVLTSLFSKVDMLIATHCEDEATIRRNTELFRADYGEDLPIKYHPIIRSAEACYLSSSRAVGLAKKFGTRLHVLHISTAKEIGLFQTNIPIEKKKITAEACIHHLWFSDKDYESKGALIKWNPAVKTENDREGIWNGVRSGAIDVIATDHAPHTIEEKSNKYFSAPSGGPLVQHALLAMLEKVKEGYISMELMVEKMAHAPAKLFAIENRGYLREGYFADIVIVDPAKNLTVNKSNLLYKCGWSPFEGTKFSNSIETTFVNGFMAYNSGEIIEGKLGERLSFNRQ
jgi:dihydroorotase|tara:strand:+ start:8719 stop:10056 length:1338 start_codon:yes stop_codon:yes gene_type:complete